jgi:hypothetical protein
MLKRTLVMQQPAVLGVKWCKDEYLKGLGIHTAGEPHRNDATRHALYYLVQSLGRTDYLKQKVNLR